jgi:hypothetical protein
MDFKSAVCAVIACTLLAVGGCASVEVKRINSGDTTTDGVRYYGTPPYLLVGAQPTEEGKAIYTTSIIYLPNYSEAYAVKVKQGWGTANGSLKLSPGGMLSEFGSAIDSKGPETITAVSGLITAVAGAVTPAMSGDDIGPGLYRIVIDPATGQAKELVRVKLSGAAQGNVR